MAASDHHPRSEGPAQGGSGPLTAGALHERLEEEVNRAERQGTGLSCLLVVFDDLDEMAREHGGELREQTLEYVAGALRRELRSFDRVGRSRERDLMVVLPGADSPRGEIVARRTLERLGAIKVESAGGRLPLRVSVGLAAWREGVSAQALVERARAALPSAGDDRGGSVGVAGPLAARWRDPAHASTSEPQVGADASPALGRMRGQ